MLLVTLALVELDDQILLIEEAKPECRGKWFLPGGRVEAGESLIECVRREVLEEAGLDIEPLGLSYVDQMIADGSGHVDRLRFVFKARPVGGQLKTVPDVHSLRAQWFRREEIELLSLRSPIVRTLLRVTDRSPVLPMSSLQILTALDKGQEQP
jgi:ADP-ribose pyrophosphatase YjhB (NUDIX family)